ncbi:furin (paired basic amino acid cleaving enzyme) a [Dunckerocampus dactyliophorus]|uniref:furin (paired basic amino acid cleaving enzyme) a n=1 Tax=Dunckerocampus dactyliophorus TaxID=161453 RepID=UPI002406C6AC|nr:furin (paired basic amino acid cleaving enzyme) a [Dunckerocampus dactyliophorus]XP_054625872.1 furin (paired basic amino acid cleaving enzyme) a [Dunckerocampus dactyliophorus]
MHLQVPWVALTWQRGTMRRGSAASGDPMAAGSPSPSARRRRLMLAELILWSLLILLVSGLEPVLSQKIYTNTWAVHIPGGREEAEQIASKHGFINHGHVFGDYYHFRHRTVVKRSLSDHRSTQVRLLKHPKVTWAEQQVVKQRKKRDVFIEPMDPQFKDQWYLYNTNHRDLNAKAAWQLGYTGKGVVVSILDDGIEKNHPDLMQNYDPDASYDVNDGDPDPQPRYTQLNDNRHGTRCAGEVAAVANNGICGVGVAYNAKIGGVRMLDGEVTDIVEAQSLSLNPQHIDIYSASWGPEDDGKTVDGPAKLAKEAFKRGVTEGRGGLGSIFVWASGNGGREKDSCNCDGYTNSIYTLSISSSTQNGNVPWYSEACSSTLATTYSSGNLNEKQIVTTDLKSKCTDSHTGTSASAPLAAGIIALALEANKNLTWRDMQHLVVRTSHPAHLLTNDWNTNGVKRKVSHSYGYGLLDASGIVALAKTWTNVGPQRKCVITLVCEPMNIGGHLSINKSVDACFGSDSHVTSLEHVQARLTLSYNRRGNLAIHLISPAGTRSTLLHPRPHDYSSEGFNDWAFMTTHSWDENPTGMWMLEIENVAGASDYGTLTQFILVLYGTGSTSSTSPDDSQPGNGSCKTLDLRQICLECNAGYYLFGQVCVKQCPPGFAVGSQPLNYTVGNYISPATVPACLPCPLPCKTCSSLSPEACLSCPPHKSLNPISGTCDHVTQYMRESPGSFMVGQGDTGSQPQLSSSLPMTVAVLSCLAIMATFAGIFLLLQLRSGALIKLPSLEAGNGLGGAFSLGGNRVVSYRGIPTVWGDDGANTDSDNEEFDVQNERTAFIKTQSAL